MFLAFRARKKAQKLRRLSVFVNSALFLDLAGVVLSKTTMPQGLFRISLISTNALILFGVFILRQGPLARATGNLWLPSKPADFTLLGFVVTFNCVFLTGLLSPLPEVLSTEDYSLGFYLWGMIWSAKMILWCAYCASFEDDTTKIQFCGLMVFLNLSVRINYLRGRSI
jgi:hypothetical protein